MFAFFVLGALLVFSNGVSFIPNRVPRYNYFAMVPYIAQPGQLWNTLEALKESIIPQMEEQRGFVDARLGFNIGENSIVDIYEFRDKYLFIEATKGINSVALLPLIKQKLDDTDWDIYPIEDDTWGMPMENEIPPPPENYTPA